MSRDILEHDLDLAGKHVYGPQAPVGATDIIRLQDLPGVTAANSTINFPTANTIKVGTLSNHFIVQGTADAMLSGAQFLGALSTGLLKNTVTTGVLSIATPGTDYQAPMSAANATIVFPTSTTIGVGTISGAYVSGWTPGSVIFASAGGTLTEANASFFWDNTHDRLGIGLTGPQSPLHVVIDSGTARGLRISDSGGTDYVDFTNGGSTMTISIALAKAFLLYQNGNPKLQVNASGNVLFYPTSNFTSTLQTPGSNNAASTEVIATLWDCSRTETWATGALTTQREIVFRPPTYAFAAASTITTAATVAIEGAPAAGSNAAITNAYSLWVQAGKTNLAGTVIIQSLTGLLKGTSGTISVATAGTDYLVYPLTDKFIVQGTADSNLTSAQFLGALATGIVKNTTTTGVLSIAVAGTDYQAPLSAANSTITFPTSTTIQVNHLSNAFIVQGTSDAMLTGAQFLGSLGTGLVKNTTSTGVLSIAVAGTDYQAPLTFTTPGNTLSGTTVTSDFVTGKSGGLTATGGTSSGDNLTLRSNTSSGGHINIGTSNYDESANVLNLINANTTASTASLAIASSSASGQAVLHLRTSTSTIRAGLRGDSTSAVFLFANGGHQYFTTGGDFASGFVRLKIHHTGDVLVAGVAAATDPSDISSLFGVTGTSQNAQVTKWAANPANIASASGATLNAHLWDLATVTITGSTNITTAGFNFAFMRQPTYTAASALTMSFASTFTIEGSPLVGGSLSVTQGYALWIQNGISRFAGPLITKEANGTGLGFTDSGAGSGAVSFGSSLDGHIAFEFRDYRTVQTGNTVIQCFVPCRMSGVSGFGGGTGPNCYLPIYVDTGG